MFVILLIASMFSQGLAIVSHGKEFITAFPENIGFFYPLASLRNLRVTALYDDTSFTVFFNNTQKTVAIPQRGATTTVMFPKTAEVYQLNYSTNSIRITSTKNVVVHSISQTDTGINLEKSVQTNVVQPIDNLGTDYLIPSLNQANIVQIFGGAMPIYWSQRYSSFKLIIINAEDVDNTVTIMRNNLDRVQEENVMIPSYQLIQLQANASLWMVKSSHKIAVILTHPCLENNICRCNMIVNQILPTQFQGQNFVVPYASFMTNSNLFMTSDNRSTSLFQNNVQFQPSLLGFLSPSVRTKLLYVTASGNVSLRMITPKVFLEIIPENMFAACYLLHFYSDASTNNKQAIVIAETDSKLKVHQQYSPIITGWTEITGTKYSSVVLSIKTQYTFIWHPSSKIGVYMLDIIGNTAHGGQAIPINDKPDESGCVVSPGQYQVGDETFSWAESLTHCTSLQQQLACPTKVDDQMDLANMINTTENEEAWIGLRRSLMTTDWYWQRQTLASSSSSSSPSMDYVHWADGQPEDESEGFCASLSLDSEDGFKWKSAKCCEQKRPVCYKPPTVLDILTSGVPVNVP